MDYLNVVSLNVRGLHNSFKRNSIYRWLKDNKYHICCIQESFCTQANIAQFKRGWDEDIYHSLSNSAHSRGVSIMLSKNLNCNVVSFHSDEHGRMILINVEIDNQDFTIVSVYAPNELNEYIVFYRDMQLFINTHASNKQNLVIGGDFNCVLSEKDRVTGKTDKSTISLNNVMVKLNVIDIWRLLNPNGKDYTYIDPSCNKRNSRIDLLLCSSALKSRSLKSVISQAPTPDYKPVNVIIQMKQSKRGKSCWKLNNSLLEIEEYQGGITRIYDEIIEEYEPYVSKAVLWDCFKLRIKQIRIDFGILQARKFKR